MVNDVRLTASETAVDSAVVYLDWPVGSWHCIDNYHQSLSSRHAGCCCCQLLRHCDGQTDSFITRKSLSVQLRVYDIGLCICLGLRYFHNH